MDNENNLLHQYLSIKKELAKGKREQLHLGAQAEKIEVDVENEVNDQQDQVQEDTKSQWKTQSREAGDFDTISMAKRLTDQQQAELDDLEALENEVSYLFLGFRSHKCFRKLMSFIRSFYEKDEVSNYKIMIQIYMAILRKINSKRY